MSAIKGLLASKKFFVLVAASAVLAIARVGLDVTQVDTEAFVAMDASYLIGQGIADHGKEAARVITTAK